MYTKKLIISIHTVKKILIKQLSTVGVVRQEPKIRNQHKRYYKQRWCFTVLRANVFINIEYSIVLFILLQALNDDDDAGGDDLAVNVDGGKMDEFFQEVEEIR